MKRRTVCALLGGIVLVLIPFYVATQQMYHRHDQVLCIECLRSAGTSLSADLSDRPQHPNNSNATFLTHPSSSGLDHYDLGHANVIRTDDRGKKITKLKSILHQFKTLLPTSFLSDFKNPCWYVDQPVEHWHQQLDSAFPFDGVRNPSHAKQVQISQQVIDEMSIQPSKTVKSLRCLPAFFLPGYSKCGTTELYKILQSHPDFASPVSKELNWWTWKKWQDEAPLNTTYLLRYFSHFAPAAHEIKKDPSNRITGDMSVLAAFDLPFKLLKNATYDDGLPFLISSLLPHSKIIFMLRDPVYKVRSAYYFFSKFGCPHKPNVQEFHKGVTNQLAAYRLCLSKLQVDAEYECLFHFERYVNTSIWPCHVLTLPQSAYYHSIRLWMRHFPRDQLLFLRMEDMTSNATNVALKVFSFLGLSPPSPQVLQAVAQKAKLKANANTLLGTRPEAETMWPETKSLLQEFFSPFNKKLAELLQDSHYLWEDDKFGAV